MKKTADKFLSLILSAGLTLSLIPIFSAAAYAADAGVLIFDNHTVKQTQSNIQHAVCDAMALYTDGFVTVTVTGSKAGADETLELDIPDRVRVIWKAEYSGSARPLIEIIGGGIFEVTAGGEISAAGDEGEGCAIRSADASVIVSGGRIFGDSIGSCAISAVNGNVTVLDGTIFVSGHSCTAIDNSYGDVTVLGGEIEAYGENNYGICVRSGNVTVQGGTVTAVSVNGDSRNFAILITDGGVAACLENTCSGLLSSTIFPFNPKSKLALP